MEHKKSTFTFEDKSKNVWDVIYSYYVDESWGGTHLKATVYLSMALTEIRSLNRGTVL